jgi:hypothetical protein
LAQGENRECRDGGAKEGCVKMGRVEEGRGSIRGRRIGFGRGLHLE